MYNIPGTPTAWFDGWSERVGGCSGSCYSTYVPYVNNHLAVSSPLEITANYVQVGLDVTLDVHIEATGLINTTSNRVHFIICEDGAHNGNVNLARRALTYEPFTLTGPGQSVDIQRTTTLLAGWTGPINIIVFVQSHGSSLDVLQAALATEGWTGDTVAVSFGCTPDNGTLPFSSTMWASLQNLTPFARRISGKINVTIANGALFTNWRAGWTNLSPAENFLSNWPQYFPAVGTLVGDNVFTLYGYDVTPAPYNQPPFAPDGDSDSSSCTITAYAP